MSLAMAGGSAGFLRGVWIRISRPRYLLPATYLLPHRETHLTALKGVFKVAPKIEQPAERTTRDGTEFSHPAFGMIGASRVQGSAVLVGSDFVHHNYIVVHVRNARLNRTLSRDWWFSDKEIISIAMSEAQWATMISSLNVGQGVPCTIEHIKGEQMPGVPHRQATSQFTHEMAEHTQHIVERVDRLIAAGGVTKAKLDELRMIRQELVSNLPFVQDQFDKHIEGTIEKAKIEVNAYVTGVVARAGIRSLTDETQPVKLLSAPASAHKPF